MAHLKLGEILIQQGIITEEQFNNAINVKKQSPERIGEILIKQGVVTEEDIIVALATQLMIPYSSPKNDLLKPQANQGLDKLIPKEFSEKNTVLPISVANNILTVAVYDPLDLMLIDNLKRITGCEINLVLATKIEITRALQQFYGIVKTSGSLLLGEAVQNTYSAESTVGISHRIETSSDEAQLSLDKLIAKAEEAPVIKLVDLIIRQAIDERASDIHIEPYKDRIRLRYRIDGALFEIPPPARHLHLPIISRIKILSKLDIAEKRLPQDGAISAKLENRTVDLRISTIPTIWGEKVVMRILDKEAVPLELAQLGFDAKQSEILRKALKSPYGLFFVTGPTGSGKSTTLYSALNETIDPTKNVITVEDPVEFKIEGINQVGVKSDIGLTFASALRAFLRQDPDIIMVGEVRDLETAQICVRAALTGHFVLSTLHTNDASSAITRLMDIGVESYLLTPSLILVLAQRLAKRLCQKCKEPYEPTVENTGGLTIKSDLIYRAKGCQECNHTGYKGRLVIAEVMALNDKIRQLIAEKATYTQIKDEARKNGMDTLFESGIKRVEDGLTSLEEILSITTLI